MHDPTLKRTTGHPGRVRDLSLQQLRALDAGSLFSDKYAGEKVPTLAEVFEAVGKRTLINVELTNYTTPFDNLVEAVCLLIKKMGLQEHVLFSSFLPSNLSKARAHLPEVPRGLLAIEGWPGAWARSFGFAFGRYQALHPNLEDVTAEQVQRV